MSGGLFYGAISGFLEYYVSQGVNTYFSEELRKKIDGPKVAGVLENIILFTLFVLALISIGMGPLVRYEKVSFYLKLICGILCLFNILLLTAAYYKLFTSTPNLSFLLVAVYLASYIVPPFLYNFKGSFCNIHKLLLGIICYMMCIPMYQIVF